MAAADRYPWYEIVEGEDLEQGDLFFDCPFLLPAPHLSYPFLEQDVLITLRLFDVVVMTQSCDLVNDKVTDVNLCPHWDLNEVGVLDISLASRGGKEAVLKGHRPRYTVLAASDLAELPMGIRIVDCGRTLSLPKGFVRAFAASQGRRLRLNSPYREHLSQAFARFFMRVGLPQNIELPG